MAKLETIKSGSNEPVSGAAVRVGRDGAIIDYNLCIFIRICISRFRRGFQKIFRKSHISDDDLRSFDSYLIKRILPHIKAYRKRYLEHDVPQGETDGEKKEWLAVIDEIIFSFRWQLEVDILFDPPNKIAFYKEYYGQYISFEDDKDKHMQQYGDSLSRAYKSFELFGKFFVRKSDVPDYDLINLNISIAKRVLPKIKAYREMFLKKNENLNNMNIEPYASLQEYIQESMSYEEKNRISVINDVDEDVDELDQLLTAINAGCSEPGDYKPVSDLTAEECKDWLKVIDEIIYAMRWCLEADMFNETPKKTAFFKEYYGQYTPPEEDENKYIEQLDDSLYRAKRGFMFFGYFLSKL